MRVEILIKVDADRTLAEETEEMEFDNEGELIEKPKAKPADAEATEDSEDSAEPTEETASTD